MGGPGSGRKRTPDHVLANRGGDTSKRREPAESLPAPDGKVARPAWLPGPARKVWDEVTPMLKQMGLLTVADAEMVARYCVTVVRYRQLEKMLAVTRGRNKLRMGSAEYGRVHRQSKQCAAELRALDRQLGFSPLARRYLGAALAPDRDETPAQQRDRLKRLAGGKSQDELDDKASRFNLGG